MEELRCPICGGQLEIDDRSLGIFKCLNCGNKTKLDIHEIPKSQLITQNSQDNAEILVSTTSTKEDENKKEKHNYVFQKSINILVLLVGLLLLILSIYIDFSNFISKGNIQLLEAIIILSVGVGMGIVSIVLSKIKANTNLGIIALGVFKIAIMILIVFGALYALYTRNLFI